MDEKIYKITLADGTAIDNLRLNGNNFISNVPIAADIFISNCSPVIISDGTTEEVHNHMELVQITTNAAGEYWFVLRDLSNKELAQMKLEHDITGMVAMTGEILTVVEKISTQTSGDNVAELQAFYDEVIAEVGL